MPFHAKDTQLSRVVQRQSRITQRRVASRPDPRPSSGRVHRIAVEDSSRPAGCAATGRVRTDSMIGNRLPSISGSPVGRRSLWGGAEGRGEGEAAVDRLRLVSSVGLLKSVEATDKTVGRRIS